MKTLKYIVLINLFLTLLIAQNFPLKISRTHKYCESKVKVKDERPLNGCGYYFYAVYYDEFNYTNELMDNWRFSMGWTSDGDYKTNDNTLSRIWVGNDTSPIHRGDIYCQNSYLNQVLTKLANPITATPYVGSSSQTYSFTTGIPMSRFKLTNGVFEAKIKIPENNLLFPAFWLLSGPTEIDIFEFYDKDITKNNCETYHSMHTTIHHHSLDCNRDRKFGVPSNFFNNDHIFRCVWTNYSIDVYLDNTLVFYATRYYDGSIPNQPCHTHSSKPLPNKTRDCNYMANAQSCNQTSPFNSNNCWKWNEVIKDLSFPMDDFVMSVLIDFIIHYYAVDDYQQKLYTDWNNFTDENKKMKTDWVRFYQPFNCGQNIQVNNENEFQIFSRKTNFLTGKSITVSNGIGNNTYLNEPPKASNAWHDFPTHIMATEEIAFLNDVIFEEGTFLRAEIVNACSNISGKLKPGSIIYEDENNNLEFVQEIKDEFEEEIMRDLESKSMTDNGAIQIYPNPAENFVMINMNEEDFNYLYKIEIVDALGRTYQMDKSLYLDISRFNQGFYIVKFYFTHGHIVVKQFTINK
ncbi:MAG: family 16 glycosylhydrolase [Bacteroidia bacterium]|nr:family 16 glycosylhydrolase [Bacteroidia bacterium]